ncbi:hypothetical protein JDV02_007317 [Purpureocillium takamizusanense]|uniref:Zn(2)-C6 fungal-type domain-containing protein n=1 Tax=Purpureocillium takamizusanense TaxID=2060973 RepID=A0A9Q8QM66_9HYPO|nr:uncharacterized protein JDV02_007317 [Purpureocillium takamizusanense]UNI21316.1 hypothetical protein JDV02_007317 [Purpureocillium takamizusanense]
MVGIPGRSKGCATCRRRKKGCDQAIPVCSQCKKSGLRCGGYSRDLTFVHSAVQCSVLSSNNGDGSTRTPQRPWLARYAKPSTEAKIIIQDSLIRSAREQLYLGHLWDVMLPKGHRAAVGSARQGDTGWGTLISSLYDKEPSLRYVVVATAMGCLSFSGTGRRDMLIKSLESYTAAVREIGKELKGQAAYERDGLVVASALMASFELVFVVNDEPTALAWAGHSEGQLAMFLARGPEAFTNGVAHQLFVDSRINMAMLAIGKRQSSPLNDMKWKTIPWRTQKKSLKDSLMDIILDIPQLLEQLTILQACSCPVGGKVQRSQLLNACEGVESALARWASRFGTQILKFDYTVTGLPLPTPCDGSEFSLLHSSIIYWFTGMMLFSVKSIALNLTTPDGIEMLQVNALARKCGRAIPLLFESSAGLSENISGLMALSVAIRYFAVTELPGQQSEEARGLESLLTKTLAGTSVHKLLKRINGGRDAVLDNETEQPQHTRMLGWL